MGRYKWGYKAPNMEHRRATLLLKKPIPAPITLHTLQLRLPDLNSRFVIFFHM